MAKVLYVFDFDGVLADTLSILVQVYNDLLEQHGETFRFTEDSVRELFAENFYVGIAKVVSASILDAFLMECIEEFHKRIDQFHLFEGMKEVVEELSSTSSVAIVSSNHTAFIKAFLEKHSLTSFKDILGGDTAESKVEKLEMMQKKYPGVKIVYIGDTQGDIEEGKKVGVFTIGVTWGFHSKELLLKSKPDAMVEKPEDLLRLKVS